MKFVTSLALLATATTVVASPVQKIFNLVSSGASDESKNGLYLSTKHEDPLNSKAVFRAQSDAADFYFVNGTVRWDAPNGAPYAIALIPGSNLQGDVGINVSPTTGSEGFSLTSEKELTTDNDDFGGWLGEYIHFVFFFPGGRGLRSSTNSFILNSLSWGWRSSGFVL